MKFRLLSLLAILLLFGSSCVSKRTYNDMHALWVYTDYQYQLLKQQVSREKRDCNWLRDEIQRLKQDSAAMDSMYRANLMMSEKDKAKLQTELISQSSSLKLSARKIGELEALLFRKDSIMKATRDRLTAALIGFSEKGVKVHVVGGKVYISLDERLLFQSAKIDVGAEGKTALLEIATALNQDTSTILTVEGHTDDIEFTGGAKTIYKDNWDISVLRATSVVKLLQKEGKVSPMRFIASGRGEYFPIDPEKTPEARKKNRRIEIIITPNLDEIARLLEAN